MIIGTLFNIYDEKSIPTKKEYKKGLKNYFEDDIFDLLLDEIDMMSLDWYSVLRKEGIDPEIISENSDNTNKRFKRIRTLNNSNTVNWYDPIISKSIIKMNIGFCIDRCFNTDSEFIEYSNKSECSFLQKRDFSKIYRQIRSKREKNNYSNNNSNVLIADKYISKGKDSRNFTYNFYWDKTLNTGQFVTYNYYDYGEENKIYNVVGKITDKRINTVDLSQSIRLDNKSDKDKILYDVLEYKFKLISYESGIKDKFENPRLIENKNAYLRPNDENRITRHKKDPS